MSLLFGWIPLGQDIQTFIHPWRIEAAAAVFFAFFLSYSLYQFREKFFTSCLSRDELKFLIFPMVAFIAWSALSMIWAPSWKSALYHTLLWIEYLVFYIIVRHILTKRSGYKYLLTFLTLTFLTFILPAIFEYTSFLYFSGNTTIGIRYSKYGELILTVFPLILIGGLRLQKVKMLPACLLISAIGIFIFSTVSRTNLVLFIFELSVITGIILLFGRFRKYRRNLIIYILGLLFSLLAIHSIILFSPKNQGIETFNRFTDPENKYSGNFRRLTYSISEEMFLAHPFVGVGADNFGMQFNNYRAIYAGKNPDDSNLSTAENELAERSHNEYLQILAELGIPGGIIFLCFLSGIAFMSIKALKHFRQISLIQIASLFGIGIFLASSMISSFSFRLIQNGFIFFFVLAIAAKYSFAKKSVAVDTKKIILSRTQLKMAYTAAMIALLLMTTHCLIRAASAYYTNQARQQADLEKSLPFYQKAFWLDNENPTAHFSLAMSFLNSKRFAEAIPHFEYANKLSCYGSTDLSYLTTTQIMAGDSAGAEQTFAKAAHLYPFSVFVRTRYASILKTNGKTAEASSQMSRALEINERQAKTWWLLITEGPLAVSHKAFEDKSYCQVMNLYPESSIYAVTTEREIMFPSEKAALHFDK